jgi:hypothetical protein
VNYKGKYSDKFDLEAFTSTSLWFNHSLVEGNATLRHAVNLVSRYMDLAVESMAGYPAMALKPPPKKKPGGR